VLVSVVDTIAVEDSSIVDDCILGGLIVLVNSCVLDRTVVVTGSGEDEVPEVDSVEAILYVVSDKN